MVKGLYLAHLVLTGRDAVTDVVWTSPGQVDAAKEKCFWTAVSSSIQKCVSHDFLSSTSKSYLSPAPPASICLHGVFAAAGAAISVVNFTFLFDILSVHSTDSKTSRGLHFSIIIFKSHLVFRCFQPDFSCGHGKKNLQLRWRLRLFGWHHWSCKSLTCPCLSFSLLIFCCWGRSQICVEKIW